MQKLKVLPFITVLYINRRKDLNYAEIQGTAIHHSILYKKEKRFKLRLWKKVHLKCEIMS